MASRKGAMSMAGQSSVVSAHLLNPGRLTGEDYLVDDPMSIAIEHVRWCRAHGDSFAQIIQSVGFVPSSQPDFDETAYVLAAAGSRS